MASTVAGRRLTESHRLAQGRIGVDTARQMLTLWRLVDVTDLDASTPGWLRAAVPLVVRQNARSAQLAASYYRLFRSVELGVPLSEFSASVQLTAAAERVATSLTVTGPVSVKRAMSAGIPLDDAAETAMTNAARAAHRLALDGGRSTLTAAVADDSRAAGWRRVTSGDPCSFCAAIADRGVVFSEDAADFAAHDGCSCSAEPVYESGRVGESRQAREFERRDLTDEEQAESNERVRRWLAAT